MTRIAIIGNSHVSALRRTWPGISAQHPGLNVEFFAAPQLFGEVCQLRDGRWFGPDESATSAPTMRRIRAINRATEIDLDACDHVFEVGREFGLGALIRLLAASDVDGLRETGAARCLSRAAFSAFLDAAAEEGRAPEWAGWTRGLSVLLQPRVAESRLAASSETKPLFDNPAGLPEAADDLTRRATAQWAATGGNVLPQPPETIGPTGLTRPEYLYSKTDSTGTEKRDVAEDHRHMGGAFAALQWAQILSTVGVSAAVRHVG